MSNSQWWYVMRASGMMAWLLLTITVLWGAIASSKLVSRGRRWVLDMHPFLASLGLAMLILHIVAAVMDSYAGVNLAAVFVPFAASWNPVAIALGVVSLWAIGAVQVTSFLKRKMKRNTWQLVHQSSYVAAWTMALHALTAGTDMDQPIVMYGATALIVVTSAVSVLRALRNKVVRPKAPRQVATVS
jgi:predicted ferric reductase